MGKEDLNAAMEQVSSAKKTYKLAKKEYNDAIRPIQSKMDSLERNLTGKIRSFGPCKLYGDRIEMGYGKKVMLSPDITAQVTVSGNTYSTTNVSGGGGSFLGGMGGAIAGGLIAGPLGAGVGAMSGSRKEVKSTTEVHDDRKCFLSISGMGGAFTCEVPVIQEGDARQFAAEIMSLGKSYPERKALYDSEMPPLRNQLATAKANTGAMDEAQKLLESAQAAASDARDAYKAEKKEAKAAQRAIQAQAAAAAKEARAAAKAEKQEAKAAAKEAKAAAKTEKKEAKAAAKAEKREAKAAAKASRKGFFNRS